MGDLTGKQRNFIEEYLQCFNATEAARRAGYDGSDATLAVIGHENLRKPKIAERIAQRFQERVMGADEVLARLSEMARADISYFVGQQGTIDWEAVHEKGYLIKEVSHTTGKNSTIKLHDAKDALALVGKHHRLFAEQVEHSGSITMNYVGNVNPTQDL